jgi:hypothetical protein
VKFAPPAVTVGIGVKITSEPSIPTTRRDVSKRALPEPNDRSGAPVNKIDVPITPMTRGVAVVTTTPI